LKRSLPSADADFGSLDILARSGWAIREADSLHDVGVIDNVVNL
jgi:hypothetical protein